MVHDEFLDRSLAWFQLEPNLLKLALEAIPHLVHLCFELLKGHRPGRGIWASADTGDIYVQHDVIPSFDPGHVEHRPLVLFGQLGGETCQGRTGKIPMDCVSCLRVPVAIGIS